MDPWNLLYLEPINDITKSNLVYRIFTQPIFVGSILFSYLYFIYKCGPNYMKNRPAFGLRKTMLAYNGCQVLFNMYIVYISVKATLSQGHILCCTVSNVETAGVHFIYLINKYSDLIETFIFVLRKKQNQISFLHVYHHCLVIFIMSLAIHLEPGSMAIMFFILNGLVHVVMYFYYTISIYVDENQRKKYDFLKKRVTQMQLVQFFGCSLHFGKCMIGMCQYHWFLILFGQTQNAVFIFLFSRFYIKSYGKNKSKKIAK